MQTTYETVEMDKLVPVKLIQVDSLETDVLMKTGQEQTFYIPPHWHRSLEFTFITKGSLSFRINTIQETYSEGELVIINSGEIHDITYYGGEECEVICLLISYDFLSQNIPNFDDLSFKLNQSESSYNELKVILEKISKAYHLAEPYSYLQINSYLYQVIYYLVKDHSLTKTKQIAKDYDFVKTVIDYIHTNYQSDLTLDIMSKEVFMSKEHFSRLFKKTIGFTFYEYLTDYRIYQSLPSLINSHQTIQEISDNHGFPNVKSFITQFKKRYNITPDKFRKQRKISIIDHNERK